MVWPQPARQRYTCSMDLRDRFAAQFAAALVDAFADTGVIARRAYDLAEAMLAERARRIDAEERRAIESEPAPGTLDAFLDQLEPEPPNWLEQPYDPSWDVDPRWSAEAPQEAGASRPSGPGLSRAMPGEADESKERSA